MTWNKLEAKSKSEPRRFRSFYLLGTALILVALIEGPTLFLNLVLSRTELDYSRARASLWSNSITVTNLKISHADEVFTAEEFYLAGLSLPSLYHLWRTPSARTEFLFLVEEASLKNFQYQSRLGQLKARTFKIRKLTSPPATILAPPCPPLNFSSLNLTGLDLTGLSLFAGFKLKLAQLSAKNLDLNLLEYLTFSDLTLSWQARSNNPESTVLSLKTFAADSLKIAADRFTRDPTWAALWLLATAETLEIIQGHLTLSTGQTLHLKSASSSLNRNFSPGNETAVTLTQALKFTIDPGLLPEPATSFLSNVIKVPLKVTTTTELTYTPRTQMLILKNAHLTFPHLGFLDLSTSLNQFRFDHLPTDLTELFTALLAGRLTNLELAFQNQGLMALLYRNLCDATTIKKIYIPLLAQLLTEVKVPAVPAILAEFQAFLDRPEHLTLTVFPPKPVKLNILPLALGRLANLGYYDIIKKLNLTLTVNDRTPVAITD
ncbi:MAG: hypothetical protein LBV77_00755 [Candidatus Adiutrix intracellularis]|jgi:hypothetical protein|nr:hypothetical protein [Candidatus Adiutrix intracellularis]